MTWRHIAALLVLALATPAHAAEAQDHAAPDHAAWDALLSRYVRDGVVDYSGLRTNDRDALEAYLDTLEAVTKDQYAAFAERDKLAFWINAYNAYTVQLILDEWPVESIKSIGLIPHSAFKRDFITSPNLEGGDISLDHIENQILRKRFDEPRIHFAIVCASKSCPALASEAYRGEKLDAQLERAVHGFLADGRRNRVGDDGKTLELSSIFDWFGEDFVKAAGSVPAFVAKHAPEPMAEVARKPGVEVEFLDYDWSLNGA